MRNISNIDELRNKLSYDDVLGVLRWKVSPSNNVKVGSVAGYIRSDGYRVLTIDGVITYAHHVIWMINNGVKWFTEFGHLNRGDMLTSEQHRCHN
ncbi:hypothetical protein RNO61_23840, partial [Escherichia coli]|nr:hypothetical protein [Escherichia coli]